MVEGRKDTGKAYVDIEGDEKNGYADNSQISPDVYKRQQLLCTAYHLLK